MFIYGTSRVSVRRKKKRKQKEKKREGKTIETVVFKKARVWEGGINSQSTEHF